MGKTKVVISDEAMVDAISASALTFAHKHFAEFADEIKLEGVQRQVARNILGMLAHAMSVVVLSDSAAQGYLAGKAKTDG